MGAPTKYDDEISIAICEFAAGTNPAPTDEQIAARFGIGISTLNLWKGKHPDFMEALKKAKNVGDQLVVNALFQKALGYRHKAIKFFCHEGFVITEEYEEVYPPDTTACIFWLKNRQPELWRDVHKLDVTATVTHTLPSRQEALKVLTEDYATLPPKDDVEIKDV